LKGHSFQPFDHSGIVTDITPEEVAADKWTSGRNVVFVNNATETAGGYGEFASPLSGLGPLFAMNVVYGAESYWIYCTADGVFVTDGETHSDITPTEGLQTVEAGEWSGTILNGIPVLSNGKDAPFYWSLAVSAPCETIPGWPTGAYCKVIRSFKYHLFALNIYDGTSAFPDTLWWSAAAAPGAIPQEWTPEPTNDAGDMTLADSPGVIMDGLSLRDTFVAYKQFATYMLSYVAGQFVFTQRKLFLTSGIQTSNCVIELNGEHWVFTGDDIIKHDGQSFMSVVQDKVKNDLVASVDTSKIGMCCAVSQMADRQFFVCIPTQGAAWLDRAYVINTITGDCGVIDLPGAAFVGRGVVSDLTVPITWDLDSGTWDLDATFWDEQTYSPTDDSLLICSPGDNKLYNYGASDSLNGTALHAYVERQGLPINDNIARALVVRVIPRIDGEDGETINIRVGGQPAYGEPILWGDPVPFLIGTDQWIDTQVEGRLISVNFDATTMRSWRVHGYRVEVTDLGLY